MRRIHWCFSAVFLAALLGIGQLTAERFFAAPPSMTDDGARKIMIANVRETGSIFLRFSEDLAPDAGYLPGGFHFQRTARGIVSFHAPYFSFLAAHLPFLCCGYTGVGLALLVTFLLTFLLPLRRMRLPVLLGLAASALTYYGPLCWEMPFAAAWGGLAVLWLLEARQRGKLWRFALAGAAIGAGLFLREEFYVLGLAAGLVLLSEGREQRKNLLFLALGGFGAALLYWGCNRFLFGHLLGVHGALYRSGGAQAFSLWNLLGNYWVFLFRFDLMPLLSAVLVLLTALGSVRDLRTLRRPRIALILAASLLWLAAALRLYRSGTPPDFLYTISLAGANPLFVFFLGSWRALWHSPQLPVRFGTRLAILYIGITPALLSQHDMGIVWGSRHFFVLFPLLAALSIYGAKHFFRRGLAMRFTIALVLTASAALLYAGTVLRDRQMQAAGALEQALRKTEGPIVTDLFFLPEMTPFLVPERPVLSPRENGALLRLAQQWRAKKIRQCILVLSPRYRKIPDSELAQFFQLYEAQPPRLIRSPRIPMLDCWIVPCLYR